MKKNLIFYIFISLICTKSLYSENFLALKIGPEWPKELLDSQKATSWEAGVSLGKVIDKVSLGLSVDFMWNKWEIRESVNDSTSTSLQTTLYKVTQKEQSYKFPVSAVILVDPIPHLLIHPVIHGQIGLNMMVFSHDNDTTDNSISTNTTDKGFYFGFLRKLGADAVYDIGEQISAFIGIEYEWGNTKKRGDSSEKFFERNMSNPHIYLGIRLTL